MSRISKTIDKKARLSTAKKKKIKPSKKKFGVGASPESISASTGNEWWLQRSKHGRDALFDDPEKLLQAFREYVKYCNDNPDYATEWKGRGLVKIPLKRVLLLQGFLMYCNTHTEWWYQFKKSKTYERDPGFAEVMKLIEQTIYNDKFSGAANGKLNANLIIRDLRLSENINMDVSEHRKAAGDLFPDEKEFLNKKDK